MKDETNITEILKVIYSKTRIQESAIKNLLNFETDINMAEYLKVLPADLDSVLSGQANNTIAQLFDLTQADLDNLIGEYGKEFILGMIVAKLLLKK